MVKKMLDLAGYTKNLVGKTILENSFGSGNILVEIVKRYIEDCIQTGLCPGTIATNLTRDIFGVELDQELFNSCVKRLNKIAGEYGILDVTWSLYNGNALTHTFDREFDFIIGNPPYIAYKDLDNDSKDYLKKNFISCKQGKFDYCYAFIECGIKLLSPAGKLVQLVPSSIYKTVFGEKLREILQPHISVIYEYPNKKLFGNTLTSNTMFLFDMSCDSPQIEYADATAGYTFNVERASLGEKWVFQKKESKENIEAPKKEKMRFGEYFHASIVVATLLNEAFILTPEQLQELNLERTVIRRAASPKMLRGKKEEYIIFPYYYDNGNLHRYHSEEFADAFPNVAAYLEGYRDKLNARNVDASAEWFEYGRSQALGILNQEKLLISTVVTNKVETYKLDAETIPYAGILITVKKSGYTLDDAVQILGDQRFLQYVNSIGISISGKSKRITCKDVNNYRFVKE